MRLLTWLLPLVLLAGCGWHLRGITPLPADYRILYLDSQASTDFNRQLDMLLKFNGVVLAERLEDAQAGLHIKPIELEKRTIALTSNGQIAEFELNALLTAVLQRNDRNTEVLIEVTGRRRVANDINNVLGTANAERQQREELEKDLANKLIMRLQRVRYDQSASSSDNPLYQRRLLKEQQQQAAGENSEDSSRPAK